VGIVKYCQKYFQDLPVFIRAFDTEGFCVFANEAWENYTGAVDGEIAEQYWNTQIHPLDLPKYKTTLQEVIRSHQKKEVQIRIKGENQKYILIQDSVKPLYSESGKYLGVVSFLIPCKNFQEQQKKVQKADDLLSILQKEEYWGWIEIDLHTKNWYVSDFFQKKIGLRPQRKWENLDFIEGHDRELFEQNLQKALENDKIQKNIVKIISKNDEIIYSEVLFKQKNGAEGEVLGLYCIFHNVTDRVLADKKLKEAILYYNTIAATIGTGILLLTSEGVVINANVHFRNLVETKGKNAIVGESIYKWITGESAAVLKEALRKNLMGEAVATFELNCTNSDEKVLPLEVDTVSIQLDTEQYILMNCRDISVQKRYEEQLRESIQEKEVLLREIHHRVKNNMAVVAGLLDLHMDYIDDKKNREVFVACQKRILSMALIHEKLYRSDNLSSISFKNYIEDLVHRIGATYMVDSKNIEVKINADETELELERALPCGLILNELVTNSFKHAFHNKNEGTITVNFYNRSGQCTLEVYDDGDGVEEEEQLKFSGSLGYILITALVRQLNATLTTKYDNGLFVKITF
jgi:PAS domain S-box-containing protein